MEEPAGEVCASAGRARRPTRATETTRRARRRKGGMCAFLLFRKSCGADGDSRSTHGRAAVQREGCDNVWPLTGSGNWTALRGRGGTPALPISTLTIWTPGLYLSIV